MADYLEYQLGKVSIGQPVPTLNMKAADNIWVCLTIDQDKLHQEKQK